MFIIYLSIIFITSFFIIFSYYNELSLQEERQYDKLKAIVSSLSLQIDGDQHAAMFERNTAPSDIQSVTDDLTYKELNALLSACVEINGLNSPMYTLVMNREDSTFTYGVRSGNYIDFRNLYQIPPKELKTNFTSGGTIPMYETENGVWLSAFYPIKNSAGEVVALLEADIDFTEFQTIVNARYLNEVYVSLGVIIILALLLIPYARRILTKDEKQKERFIKQTKIIESKNRDIMDSIRYAQKIQNAMLPSKDSFKIPFQDSFLFYCPKDVVAGDFYWLEEVDDFVFFAVADCTGHGVPGAIVSLICANALNRAVVENRIFETNEILDHARELIISRMGKGDQNMKDGMDISLCRLNLKTLELQFTGANNPLYLFSKGELSISPPCKQPVGKFIKQVPFKATYYQLNKGDKLYLFTDGFADQFGGPNGKKYKYKNFKNLLLKHSNSTMEAQNEQIAKELKNWMGNIEQLDDICILGVEI